MRYAAVEDVNPGLLLLVQCRILSTAGLTLFLGSQLLTESLSNNGLVGSKS